MTSRHKEALDIIREYLLNYGRSPSIREIQTRMGYGSPRSASLLLEDLEERGLIIRKAEGGFRLPAEQNTQSNEVVNIPLVGNVACGTPIFAEENIEATIPVSIRIANPPEQFFFLRARGDSMNEKGINDGDLVLIRQQVIARNGDIVLALINDKATLKEFRWSEDAVLLIPHSTNPEHKPIILDGDFLIQGIVVKSFGPI